MYCTEDSMVVRDVRFHDIYLTGIGAWLGR